MQTLISRYSTAEMTVRCPEQDLLGSGWSMVQSDFKSFEISTRTYRHTSKKTTVNWTRDLTRIFINSCKSPQSPQIIKKYAWYEHARCNPYVAPPLTSGGY